MPPSSSPSDVVELDAPDGVGGGAGGFVESEPVSLRRVKSRNMACCTSIWFKLCLLEAPPFVFPDELARVVALDIFKKQPL